MENIITKPCKEESCEEIVTYKRQTVLGFRTSHSGSKTISVYLTCPQDHTHKYEIEKET